MSTFLECLFRVTLEICMYMNSPNSVGLESSFIINKVIESVYLDIKALFGKDISQSMWICKYIIGQQYFKRKTQEKTTGLLIISGACKHSVW